MKLPVISGAQAVKALRRIGYEVDVKREATLSLSLRQTPLNPRRLPLDLRNLLLRVRVQHLGRLGAHPLDHGALRDGDLLLDLVRHRLEPVEPLLQLRRKQRRA